MYLVNFIFSNFYIVLIYKQNVIYSTKFIAAATAMNLVEPQLKWEAKEGVEWQCLQYYLLRSIKWCDDTIASAANGTYDANKTPPKFYDL